MKQLCLVICVILSGILYLKPVSATEQVEKQKRRLEDLFIWKISDELKLTIQEEKNVAELIRKTSELKNTNNARMNELIKKLSLNQSKQSLNEHKKLMTEYHQINLNEVESIEKAIGFEKTIRYILVKNDLTQKVKSILATGEVAPVTPSSAAKPLPQPKIIEE